MLLASLYAKRFAMVKAFWRSPAAVLLLLLRSALVHLGVKGQEVAAELMRGRFAGTVPAPVNPDPGTDGLGEQPVQLERPQVVLTDGHEQGDRCLRQLLPKVWNVLHEGVDVPDGGAAGEPETVVYEPLASRRHVRHPAAADSPNQQRGARPSVDPRAEPANAAHAPETLSGLR